MRTSYWWCLPILLVLAMPVVTAKEKREKKEKGAVPSLTAIEKKLADKPLTDEQKTKVEALREDILKKVKAGQEGLNPTEAFKTGLKDILTEEQMAVLYPEKGAKKKGKKEGKGEKKKKKKKDAEEQ